MKYIAISSLIFLIFIINISSSTAEDSDTNYAFYDTILTTNMGVDQVLLSDDGKYVYVVDTNNGIFVYSLESSGWVGSYSFAGQNYKFTKKIFTNEELVYVVSLDPYSNGKDTYELVILEDTGVGGVGSNRLQFRGNYTINPLADDIVSITDLKIHDNYAYLTNREKGLIVLNVENYDAIYEINDYEISLIEHDLSSNFVDITIAGDNAYIANGNNGFVVVDISNPASITEVTKIFNWSQLNYVSKIIISGNYAYIANGDYNILIADISIPTNPIYLNKFSIPLEDADFNYGTPQITDISILENRLFATYFNYRSNLEINGANQELSFGVFNLSNSENPEFVESYYHGEGEQLLVREDLLILLTRYDSVVRYSLDSDNDGVSDSLDDFPNNKNEWKDSDGDGYGDNSDVFPYNWNEWLDFDGDGYGDNNDVFPNNRNEWEDTDRDGYGDNEDAFDFNPDEWRDSDGDGYGDNFDAFPNDPSEWRDSDGDGYGNGEDVLPNNPYIHSAYQVGISCGIIGLGVARAAIIFENYHYRKRYVEEKDNLEKTIDSLNKKGIKTKELELILEKIKE